MKKKLDSNPWRSLVNQIIKTILLSIFVLGIVQLVKHLMPPPPRNKWIDFSYIIALEISIVLTLIVATFWGKNLVPKSNSSGTEAFCFGAIWGAAFQSFVSLICMLTTSAAFHFTQNWLFNSLVDLVILSYIVGVCVLGGFALKKQDWNLLVLTIFLLIFGVYVFFGHYLILF